MNQPFQPPAGRRYCSQPAQRARAFSPEVSAQRASAIISGARKWVGATNLTYYCFHAGDAAPAAWQGGGADLEAVELGFRKWADLGLGLAFTAVARPEDAILRIGFDQGDGSWSYVGRDALLLRDPAERTMNFGWPLTTAYGRDTVLHEIGHAMGLEHEHQNPFAGIVWEEEAVRSWFRGPPNHWDDDQIERNILRKMPRHAVKGTAWDPDSIMEYEFEPGLIREPTKYFTDGLRPRGGLSGFDQDWARSSYPPLAPSLPQLEVGLSQRLALGRGETRVFGFRPPRTRTYRIGTFGVSDTVLVLFEETPSGNLELAGDDDSGQDRNAHIAMRLNAGRAYQVGVRLYYADAVAETALMAW